MKAMPPQSQAGHTWPLLTAQRKGTGNFAKSRGCRSLPGLASVHILASQVPSLSWLPWALDSLDRSHSHSSPLPPLNLSPVGGCPAGSRHPETPPKALRGLGLTLHEQAFPSKFPAIPLWGWRLPVLSPRPQESCPLAWVPGGSRSAAGEAEASQWILREAGLHTGEVPLMRVWPSSIPTAMSPGFPHPRQSAHLLSPALPCCTFPLAHCPPCTGYSYNLPFPSLQSDSW